MTSSAQPTDLGPVTNLLLGYGFVRRGPCFVRRKGSMTEMVEPQTAVYAARMTLNLGLGLTTLAPALPWDGGRDALVPSAHRWIRIGRVMPGARDRWWDLTTDRHEAYADMAEALVRHGLPWLSRESEPDAFLAFAEARRARSRSEVNPHGGFDELRLCVAVHCWRGESKSARRLLPHVEQAWRVERPRLQHARLDFSASQSLDLKPEEVPDLLDELRRLVEASSATEG